MTWIYDGAVAARAARFVLPVADARRPGQSTRWPEAEQIVSGGRGGQIDDALVIEAALHGARNRAEHPAVPLAVPLHDHVPNAT